jgi:hypothetical protein
MNFFFELFLNITLNTNQNYQSQNSVEESLYGLREEQMVIGRKVKDLELELQSLKLNTELKIRTQAENLKELNSLKKTSLIIA